MTVYFWVVGLFFIPIVHILLRYSFLDISAEDLKQMIGDEFLLGSASLMISVACFGVSIFFHKIRKGTLVFGATFDAFLVFVFGSILIVECFLPQSYPVNSYDPKIIYRAESGNLIRVVKPEYYFYWEDPYPKIKSSYTIGACYKKRYGNSPTVVFNYCLSNDVSHLLGPSVQLPDEGILTFAEKHIEAFVAKNEVEHTFVYSTFTADELIVMQEEAKAYLSPHFERAGMSFKGIIIQ